MKKSIVLITGSSSWWKSKKYRKESFLTLMRLKKQNWRLYKIEEISPNPYSIDTKLYKKYHLVK